MTLLIEFLIFIDRDFKVKAFRGSTHVNIRAMIDSFHCKLTLYSQLNDIICHLSNYPLNIQNDLKHVGEHLTKLVNDTNFDNKEKKKIAFLCNQMILHGKESGDRKHNANDIRDALDIFLRSRNAHRALRDYLILPCGKTLKSCFGKLGSTGNSEECKSSVGNVFSELDGQENYCFITADEIYVKAAVSRAISA